MKRLHVGRVRVPIASAWLVPVLITAVLAVVLAAAAAAAIETHTVGSFWKGLWWAISLTTTVGFIGEPPESTAGAVLSAALMILGFLVLAMVSASLAALFVREEEHEFEALEEATGRQVLETLARLEARLAALEEAVAGRDLADVTDTTEGTPAPDDAGPDDTVT